MTKFLTIILFFALWSLLFSGRAFAEIPDSSLHISPLLEHQQNWPDWHLPGPMQRPSKKDEFIYPGWFKGPWMVENLDLGQADKEPISYLIKFERYAGETFE